MSGLKGIQRQKDEIRTPATKVRPHYYDCASALVGLTVLGAQPWHINNRIRLKHISSIPITQHHRNRTITFVYLELELAH
jgi:hypothetical protein